MVLFLAQSLLFLIVAYYAVYALLEIRLVLLAKKCERAKLIQLDPAEFPEVDRASLPAVSVLLPVYNESLVVERLIDAVCSFDYPVEKLEVLVLDDSTDETTELAAARVAAHAARGLRISLLRRPDRTGYKAGNLRNGIRVAKGEFLAIFDADFIPPENFLLKTIPCFSDPNIGFLQTGIGYTNGNASFLTRFQAMEMGHQQFVTVGLSHDGLMGSLSGSSCVWRRACVDSLGGWDAATITEDVDLGYRAQFQRWKYVFLRDVVSLSELPETISGFRIQRDRWARGLIHNAFKHFQAMLATRMSPVQRLHALSLMFSALLLASFYVLILLSLPLALLTDALGTFFNLTCSLFLLTALAWGVGNFVGSSNGAGLASDEPGWQRALQMVAYVAMFLPMSLYYFCSGLQVLFGRQGGFNRTPKGGGGKGRALPPINTLLSSLEVLTFFYSLASLVAALLLGNYWIVLFNSIVCGGFAVVLWFSWRERRSRSAQGNWALSQTRILITGASGSIGRALALEYAQPGRTLILQGRRADRLRELAEACSSCGAQVLIQELDLRDRQQLRSWLAGLCETEPLDLVIFNAGLNTNIGPAGEGERWEDVEQLIEVNLLAAMTTVDAVLPAMRRYGRGQLALMSSLAGYFGLPVTPSYSASKAALKAYGESLRGWLGPEGIRVSVVMPGYVESPMCRAMPGPKPFLWPPEKAARCIRRGLERNRARITFPFPLNLGTWFLAVLPAGCSTKIARWLGYGSPR